MKNYITIGLMLVASLTIQAQTTLPFTLSYLPPSPNVAALGKFGDTPVGLSTGIPSIEIPIHEYSGTSNGLNLKVALSYHAGGVRVEETASNVGLGWALNAGGNVSRTMRSLPDDLPIYGYLALGPNQNPLNSLSMTNAYSLNGYDGEQDAFSFSLNGSQGKFILDASGNAMLINDSKVLIKTLPGNNTYPITGFVITDIDGIQYFFKVPETTSSNLSSLLNTVNYTSTWHLSKILNPFTLDSITFAYQSYGGSVQPSINSDSYVHSYNGGGSVLNPNPTQILGSTGYTLAGQRLSQITFPDYTQINFNYNSVVRCDLVNDNALQSIDVVTNYLINGNQPVNKKTFNLYQTYIGSAGGIIYPYSPSPCSSDPDMRLRLDSLAEQSGTITEPGYVFTYDDRYHLPGRTSRKQDAWGFYNSSAAGTLVPSMITTDANGNYITLSGANIKPDTGWVKASSLVMIKYPTGGTTRFTYEANQAGDNKLWIPYINNGFVRATPDFSANKIQTFSVNRINPQAPVVLNFLLGYWCSGIPTSSTVTMAVMSLDGLTTFATKTFSNSDVGTHFPINVSSFPNGNYNLTYSASSGACTDTDAFQFSITWPNLGYDKSQYAGGLRVKTITDYDGITHANDVSRSYTYNYPNGTSSGTVGTRLDYNYQYYDGDQNQGGTTKYLTRTASTKAPLAYVQGAPIAYGYVAVSTKNGSSNNGKEVSYFYTFKEWSDVSFAGAPPFTPPQYIDWAIGQLTKKEVYNSSGVLINRQTNNYNYSELGFDNYWNIKVFHYINNLTISTNDYTLKNYNWVHGHLWKTSTVETTYSSPTDSISKVTLYDYDANYYSIKKTRTPRSLGDTIETRMYYPYDYNSVSVFPAMVSANMISKPVSSETWLANGSQRTLTNAYALDYKQQGTLIKPSKYYTLATASPIDQSVALAFNPAYLTRPSLTYRKEVTFENYDSKGNPLQLLNKGVRKSYVWDYKNLSVVAEATNASVGDVAYTSFEADGSGNWIIPSSSRVSSNSYTGFSCYDLINGSLSKNALNPARTYLVSFWSPSSNVLVNSIAPTAGITANGWTYYEAAISNATSVSINANGLSALIDEVRLMPKEAVMTTYTYEPGKGAKSITDTGNLPNLFEYDDLGRLKTVRDPKYKVSKTYQYHYKNQASGSN